MELNADELAEARRVIARALEEDLRYGPDVTTLATVGADATTTASMVVRQPGVIAGVDIAMLALDEVLGTGGYVVKDRVEDGARLESGGAVLTVEAPTQGLLTAERTTLNLVCHLSGIATTTAAWVAAVEGTNAKIRDTRKTLPGLRALQKYAVRVGGGVNHRMGLGDAALIKDNHVAAAGSVVAALRAVREAAPDLPCEVEVDSLEQLDEVLAENVELVLLDNFPVWQTQIAVQRRDSRSPTTKLESSGGLSLDTAAEYAGTGVDYSGRGSTHPFGAGARHRIGSLKQHGRRTCCAVARWATAWPLLWPIVDVESRRLSLLTIISLVVAVAALAVAGWTLYRSEYSKTRLRRGPDRRRPNRDLRRRGRREAGCHPQHEPLTGGRTRGRHRRSGGSRQCPGVAL